MGDRADVLLRVTAAANTDPLTVRWVDERERWSELLFAVAARVSGASHAAIRSVVSRALHAELDSPAALADRSSPEALAYRTGWVAAGLSETQADQVCDAFATIATVVVARDEGMPGRFLRRHGERLREEIVSELTSAGAGDRTAIGDAVTLWLQNVLELPLPLRHPALVDAANEGDVT